MQRRQRRWWLDWSQATNLVDEKLRAGTGARRGNCGGRWIECDWKMGGTWMMVAGRSRVVVRRCNVKCQIEGRNLMEPAGEQVWGDRGIGTCVKRNCTWSPILHLTRYPWFLPTMSRGLAQSSKVLWSAWLAMEACLWLW